MSPRDAERQRLIQTYRKKAKHYSLISHLYPVPGYPLGVQRHRAVRALGLRRGATVVDLACGTGQNFALIERAIGPDGRIIGVDLTDAMLAQAERRIEHHHWRNVSLVQADAADYAFPAEVDAILSTYALSHLPDCRGVIAGGARALNREGRLAVLDLKAPAKVPHALARLGVAVGRPFGAIDAWFARRPWEGVHAAMAEALDDLHWCELCFGTAFLATGAPSAFFRDQGDLAHPPGAHPIAP
jgi:ubiquinone/menaquinone biosynthesis C-methylase UbiE